MKTVASNSHWIEIDQVVTDTPKKLNIRKMQGKGAFQVLRNADGGGGGSEV